VHTEYFIYRSDTVTHYLAKHPVHTRHLCIINDATDQHQHCQVLCRKQLLQKIALAVTWIQPSLQMHFWGTLSLGN